MYSIASAFTTTNLLRPMASSVKSSFFCRVPPVLVPRNPKIKSGVSRDFTSNSGQEFSNEEFFKLFSSVDEEVDPGKVDGTDLRILKYPHPSLRAENADCTQQDIESGDISKIAKEMFLVMYAAAGVGLAAPQVGINKRLMVYNESGDPKKWLNEITMVNPKIVEFSEAKDIENEGCLSFPNMRGDVERSKWIKVEALNLRGKKIKKKFKGWEARIFQHEYDHLDGIVYPDRLTEDGKNEVQPRLDELIADFGEGGSP
eukprot:CAMPEP_0184859502 /NCGR_PEP_ID=MMETSP0580-20130426/4481_1 /TAXON_ID=1118495 /ORGANISM="Dactyliosolen fragilissimus" /LENGTH=257 /DNA_ID=CAMNT_0027356145 /DNA_START=109 /DNA_END=882 /DNA_ORIENTATION=-